MIAMRINARYQLQISTYSSTESEKSCKLLGARPAIWAVPHSTVECCAMGSTMCQPWCPRSVLCSIPPLSGPDPAC